jgi:hypothetical protein
MIAPITEAHRALAEKLGDLLDVEQMTGPSPAEQAAQLIADSEAQAVVAAHAVTAVYAERDQLRAEVERLKKQAVFDGDHIHALNAAFATRAEVTDANARAERAEASLHAMRLVCGTTDADKFSTWVDRANARLDRAEAEIKDRAAMMRDVMRERDAAEAELAAERARLRDLWCEMALEYRDERISYVSVQITRSVWDELDAAMKEGK